MIKIRNEISHFFEKIDKFNHTFFKYFNLDSLNKVRNNSEDFLKICEKLINDIIHLKDDQEKVKKK